MKRIQIGSSRYNIGSVFNIDGTMYRVVFITPINTPEGRTYRYNLSNNNYDVRLNFHKIVKYEKELMELKNG